MTLEMTLDANISKRRARVGEGAAAAPTEQQRIANDAIAADLISHSCCLHRRASS
jgi:hypothetical protein